MYVPSSGSRQGFLVQCGHQNHATSSAVAIHNSYPICWCLAEGIDRIYGIYFRILVKSWCNANVDIKMMQPLHLQISYYSIVIAVCTQFFWGLFNSHIMTAAVKHINGTDERHKSSLQVHVGLLSRHPMHFVLLLSHLIHSNLLLLLLLLLHLIHSNLQLGVNTKAYSLLVLDCYASRYIVKLTIQWNLFWSERLERAKQHQSLA